MYLSMLETDADRDIFQKLYVENEQKLYWLAKKFLTENRDAEDAVANAFLNMAEKFSTYRHLSYEELVLISNTIVKNAAIDIIRKYNKENVASNEEIEEKLEAQSLIKNDVLEQLMDRYDNALITKALMEMEPEDRRFMELRYIMNLIPKQIAGKMSSDSATVRKRLLKCRKELSRILEGKDYESLR